MLKFSDAYVGVVTQMFLHKNAFRERDYLPPINDADNTKGGDEFLQFIKMELIPYMEQNYSTDPNDRGLMGYSLGGLFTTWAFKEEPELFHKLAIISPSLWYGDEYLFEDEALLNNIKNAGEMKIIISCGSLEGDNMISNANRLYQLLQENKNIQAIKVLFDGETHGSVGSAAMSRGLYYLYKNKYKAFIKKGEAFYKKQVFDKSLEQFELAFAASPRQVDKDDRYNIACLFALTGDIDNSFKNLQILAESKFDDYESIAKDNDFTALHNDDRWEDLLSLVKKNKETTSNK